VLIVVRRVYKEEARGRKKSNKSKITGDVRK
jgi:hypothetical protein